MLRRMGSGMGNVRGGSGSRASSRSERHAKPGCYSSHTHTVPEEPVNLQREEKAKGKHGTRHGKWQAIEGLEAETSKLRQDCAALKIRHIELEQALSESRAKTEKQQLSISKLLGRLSEQEAKWPAILEVIEGLQSVHEATLSV